MSIPNVIPGQPYSIDINIISNAQLASSDEKNKALVQINPAHPTGLEPPPPDYQYDVPHQMKKPLIFENRVDANDLRNIHNPGKYDHTLGEYAQVNDPKNATLAVKTAVKEAPQLKKEKVVPVAASMIKK